MTFSSVASLQPASDVARDDSSDALPGLVTPDPATPGRDQELPCRGSPCRVTVDLVMARRRVTLAADSTACHCSVGRHQGDPREEDAHDFGVAHVGFRRGRDVAANQRHGDEMAALSRHLAYCVRGLGGRRPPAVEDFCLAFRIQEELSGDRLRG